MPWTGGVVIDSRDVLAGDLFWALPGSTFHGARFIPSALEHGAAGVVTDQPVAGLPAGSFAIKVENSISALSVAAREVRRQFAGKVVAVTGSVGKTTTRELIHQALRSRFTGSASPHNYNNHLGVPLSILEWDHDQDYAVLELGERHWRDSQLAQLAAPQTGGHHADRRSAPGRFRQPRGDPLGEVRTARMPAARRHGRAQRRRHEAPPLEA